MSNPAATVNFNKFVAFVDERNEQCDWEDYSLPDKTDLNKKMIARDCCFDRKRITGNAKIKERYDEVVINLRRKGVLVEDKRTGEEKHTQRNQSISKSRDSVALKKAQETSAALEEELFRTKAELEKTKNKLTRLAAIEQYMMETGRL